MMEQTALLIFCSKLESSYDDHTSYEFICELLLQACSSVSQNLLFTVSLHVLY